MKAPVIYYKMQMPFSFLHMLFEANRSMIGWINQQGTRMSCTASLHAIFGTSLNTPPQVDRYACKNRNVRAFSARRRRAFYSFVVARSLHFLAGAQKKNGTKPPPEKTKPPDREGDKGKQRVKRTKKEK